MIRWLTLFRSRPRSAIAAFTIGLLFSFFVHIWEPSPLRYSPHSVFERPHLIIDYSRFLFAVFAVPVYVWLLGMFSVPSTDREKRTGVFVLSVFGGIFAGVTVTTGIQCLRAVLG